MMLDPRHEDMLWILGFTIAMAFLFDAFLRNLPG
jgi:hypothetical protein